MKLYLHTSVCFNSVHRDKFTIIVKYFHFSNMSYGTENVQCIGQILHCGICSVNIKIVVFRDVMWHGLLLETNVSEEPTDSIFSLYHGNENNSFIGNVATHL